MRAHFATAWLDAPAEILKLEETSASPLGLPGGLFSQTVGLAYIG